LFSSWILFEDFIVSDPASLWAQLLPKERPNRISPHRSSWPSWRLFWNLSRLKSICQVSLTRQSMHSIRLILWWQRKNIVSSRAIGGLLFQSLCVVICAYKSHLLSHTVSYFVTAGAKGPLNMKIYEEMNPSSFLKWFASNMDTVLRTDRRQIILLLCRDVTLFCDSRYISCFLLAHHGRRTRHAYATVAPSAI